MSGRKNVVMPFMMTGFLALSNTAMAATLKINPIQVCGDDGTSCAPVNLNRSYTEKIFAQSGTTLEFGPIRQLNSNKYLNPDNAAITELRTSSTILGSTERRLGYYDVWFVNLLNSSPGFRGVASLAGDGALIASTAAVDTLAHELGHNIGYPHVDDGIIDAKRFLLARGATREIPTTTSDIAPDGKQLSRFDPILPEVTVDTVGSTPFDAKDFFDVQFAKGAAVDLFLKSMTIDLSPAGAFFDVTNADPGQSGSPFGYGTLQGISESDITVNGLADGSSMIELLFADGTFGSGDALSFGADIDLFSGIDNFGATPDELRATTISLTFSNGFATTGSLDDLVFISVFDPNQYVDVLTTRTADPDPSTISPVPVPASGLLLFGALGAFGALRRRRL